MHFFNKWKWRWLLVLAIGVSATSIFLACSSTLSWVGRKDLAVRFHVVDSGTGQSVSNAVVHIRALGGGFCADREPGEFTVTTYDNGQVELICKQCMCFGRRGMFQDTFSIHLPSWWVHATAPGYGHLPPIYLLDSEFGRQADRGTAYATVAIPMSIVPLGRSVSLNGHTFVDSQFNLVD